MLYSDKLQPDVTYWDRCTGIIFKLDDYKISPLYYYFNPIYIPDVLYSGVKRRFMKSFINSRFNETIFECPKIIEILVAKRCIE